MTSRVRGILAGLDKLGRFFENTALIVLLGGMILIAFAQIVMRELLDTGVIWADELVKIMVLWLAMIGSIAAARDDRHIRIDVLSHLLPDKAMAVTRMVVDLFAAAVCVVIAWHAWRYLQLEIEFEDTVLVDTPAWVAHIVVPVAFALTGYRFVVAVLTNAFELITGEELDYET